MAILVADFGVLNRWTCYRCLISHMVSRRMAGKSIQYFAAAITPSCMAAVYGQYRRCCCNRSDWLGSRSQEPTTTIRKRVLDPWRIAARRDRLFAWRCDRSPYLCFFITSCWLSRLYFPHAAYTIPAGRVFVYLISLPPALQSSTIKVIQFAQRLSGTRRWLGDSNSQYLLVD